MSWARRERDERGAVAVVVAVFSLVMVLVAAFAVDLGVQRVARRDMQSLADIVALDLARELTGDPFGDYNLGDLQDKADASRDRNDDTIGDEAQVTPELGMLSASGDFEAADEDADIPNAVRVVATTAVGFAFVPGSGGASRPAVAVAENGACFKVGSYAANLDTSQSALLNSLLGGLLGTSLSLNAVSYNGLASTSVTLADLVEVDRLGVGTVDELLALDGVKVGDFYLAIADVLDNQGNLVQAELLRSIAVAAGTPTIAIGDLIQAAPGSSYALNAALNVLDLVTGAAYVAHNGSAVSIPNLGITLPAGIGTVAASLNVIEAPRIACGGVGTVASTAQVRLSLTFTIPARTVNIAGIGSVSLAASSATVSLDLASARGTLTAVNCPDGEATSIDVALASEVLGGLSLGASMGINATIGVLSGSDLLSTILNVLGLNLLQLLSLPTISVNSSVSLSASTPINTWSKPLTLPLPESYTTPQGGGSNVILSGLSVTPQVGTTVTLKVKQLLGLLGQEKTYTYNAGPIFDGLVTPIVSAVSTTLLTPIIQSLQTQVVAPLAKILGLQLGGADVWAIPEPACGTPILRG